MEFDHFLNYFFQVPKTGLGQFLGAVLFHPENLTCFLIKMHVQTQLQLPKNLFFKISFFQVPTESMSKRYLRNCDKPTEFAHILPPFFQKEGKTIMHLSNFNKEVVL